jgi:MFS transporter, DHA1 family, multidrug resistance protein
MLGEVQAGRAVTAMSYHRIRYPIRRVDPVTRLAYLLPMTQHNTTALGPSRPGQLSTAEFIPLMASMTALGAMSIDGMLPSLSQIGRELAVSHPNDVQLVISAIFGGMIFGGLLGGPLSDSFGRKTAIFWGLAVYILGSALCVIAPTFPLLLAGRVLQGFGASIPAIVSIALVRDLYVGDAMARIMSFSMSVFILVPIVAPAAGQAVLHFGGWRLIFGVYVVVALMIAAWFGLRQPETLEAHARQPFSAGRILGAAGQVVGNRAAMGFTTAAGILFGAFLGYLSSSQQIFQDTYGVGTAFPYYFASLAASVGIAMFANGALVMRFGMRRLANLSFIAIAGLALAFLPVVIATGGRPPLWMLWAYLATTFFSFGAVLGNLNALSMQALGHVAGVASAIIGSLRMAISLPLGLIIGRSYDGTVLPLVIGFAVLGCLALVATLWAERSAPAATLAAKP